MTLNGVMAVILRYFSEIGSFWGALRKSGWRYRPPHMHFLRQKCSPKVLGFSDISLGYIDYLCKLTSPCASYDVGNPSIGGGGIKRKRCSQI